MTARALEVRLGEALAVPRKDRRLTAMGGQRSLTAVAPVLDPRLLRQLQSLGYIQ